MGNPTFIATLAAWATAVSALATIASAVVIAIQAKLTRESVGASKDAVAIAQRSLEESQIARLEAGAPRLSVSAFPTLEVYVEPEPFSPDEHAKSRYLASDTILKMTRDRKWVVDTSIQFSVKNDGPGTVRLRFSHPTKINGRMLPRVAQVAAGDTLVGVYFIRKTLEGWIEAIEHAEGDPRSVTHTFEISYTGVRDADIDEHHTITTRGVVVAPVEHQQGDWEVLNDFRVPLKCQVEPASRTYWKSRQRDLRFDPQW